MAFAENPVVKVFLEQSGAEALPLILIDGAVMLSGRYPSRSELAHWLNRAGSAAIPLTEQTAELIALGASIAAGCEPCFKFHYDKARKLGVSNEIMLEAVTLGNMVKQASGKNMLELAHRILDKQSADKTASTCGGSSPAEKTADTGGCCR